MALTQVYTAIPNDVITAARWNNEFGNMYNNGTDLAFPLPKDVSLAGFTVSLDELGNTTLNSTLAQAFILTPGSKDGSPGAGANQGSGVNIKSFTFNDSATAGSGTAAEFSSTSIGTPTLTATNSLVTTTDAATLYVQAAPIASTNQTITNAYALWIDSGTVRLDGNLTVAGTTTFTGGVTGVNIDDNPIINGGMDIWQRGTTFAPSATDTFSADRWKSYQSTTGVFTINRTSASLPTVSTTVPLFNYALEVDVTTSDTITAAEYSIITHIIEGYNWRAFAQRDFVISFHVLSSKTGVHCVGLRNDALDRYFIGEYTVNAANTWEYKSIVVPASPSAGTWNYTTGKGLEIMWILACGSDLYATAGVWGTGNKIASSSQVNVLDNTANFWRITGVKLELGSVATPFRHRSFGSELELCKRYYQKSFPYDTTPAQNAGLTGCAEIRSQMTSASGMEVLEQLSVAMRAVPTITTYNPSATNAQVRNSVDAADDSSTAAGANTRTVSVAFTANAANTIGDYHNVHWTASIEL